ncbi:Peroxisomal acyl-coenzyme A oxidase 2 [Strongyloides ratti]|uniref:Acyl-coenzyme A oxidase n=1 Tax=Strongyloides ratti TaxID=34506 RepID=A0A090L9Y7_STRRB|nr:Peroxisomal acyl-coenzyme A oxidase 2 [Strongyloides ratti]CEF64310.1 Peroxisomal acyl-coenzyme A oxidase 2 [Strongyloides ratti]
MANYYIQSNDNFELIEERKKCSFDTQTLATLYYGGVDKLKKKRDFEKFIENLPEFQNEKPIIFMSRLERFEVNSKKCVAFLEHFFNEVETSNPNEAAMFYEKFFSYEGSPLSLHFFVFLPNILNSMEGKQQEYWLNLVMQKKIIGTYAQTEMGHGTNLRKLETTATYDKESDTFIINSPTTTSTKWWPGNLGKTCNVTIVVAQLYIDGKCYGPHSFMVQIRDFNTHMPLPGITVGDIGPKFAFSSIDNGFIRFNNVKIPRKFMFMKYAQVEKGGKYIKPIHEKAAYGSMVFVRSVMIHQQAQYLAMACTIAIRYSCIRRQGELDDKTKEVKVLDYQTQQYRLFPQLAKTWAFICGGKYILDLYNKVNQEMSSGNTDLLPQLHCLTSGLKAVISYQVGLGIEQCRMSCGGHGYSHASGLPNIYATQIGGCTYEGENMVMLQQCARYIMKIIDTTENNESTLKNNKLFGYFFKNYNNQKHNNIQNIFEKISYYTAIEVKNRLNKLKESGIKHEIAWNECAVDLCQAAKAHIRVFLCFVYNEFIKKIDDLHIKNTLNLLKELWETYELNQISAAALKYNLISGEKLDEIKIEMYNILKKIRPHAVSIVDSFDFSDRDLISVLGRRDGNVYENLLKWAQESELNQYEVLPSHTKYLLPMTNDNKKSKL